MLQQRNIGIFAHVDAGKTTLTEQILVHTGTLKRAGSVDRGTAFTDALPVERRRGISVKAVCTAGEWKNTRICLIDTPGHMDFAAEVERSFWAPDAAILLVDGAEGVQPQTESLFRALREQDMPVLFFINKTDRPEAELSRVLKQIRGRLTDRCVLPEDREATAEYVCGRDDALAERWLCGESIPENEILTRLRELTCRGEVFPVYSGSALRDEGIEALLDAVIGLLPAPVGDRGPLSGVVFSSTEDKAMGRGLWVRLYSGKLENRTALELPAGRDPLTGEERSVQRKITQIRDVRGKDTGILCAGETGVVYGLGDTEIGYILGNRELLPRRVEPGSLKTPLITVKVLPDSPERMFELRKACEALSQEDPLLHAEFNPVTGELLLRVMGRVQLEILQETLSVRFGIGVSFGEPSVIYRETLAEKTRGFVTYTMPKPCWAILEFEMEPGPRGSGVTYHSALSGTELSPRYQHQVEQALPLALKQGRLGWQVTDVRITLMEGNSHQFHTHPLDFIVATPMAIQDGLRRGGSVLLEPVMEDRFLVPSDCAGRVMSDVRLMRGQVLSTEGDGEYTAVDALLPLSESMDYAQQLASLSAGRGSMSSSLHGYEACPAGKGRTAARRGVDPLDTSRYILAARSALEGGIFDF